MIGAGVREAQCPYCLSSDRERLVYLYCAKHTNLFREPLRVLHVAPEIGLGRALQAQPNIQYVSADLRSKRAMIQFDLTSIPLSDGSFDAVICNHVLGYIPNEERALSEIRRVLKPGGWAILQVGISALLPRTLEDVAVETDAQSVNVRLYGRDYAQRLEAGGFETRVSRCDTSFSREEVERYCLLPDEDVFFCCNTAPIPHQQIPLLFGVVSLSK